MIEFETKKVEEKDKVILQLNNSLEVVRGKVRWVENKFSQELGLYHGKGVRDNGCNLLTRISYGGGAKFCVGTKCDKIPCIIFQLCPTSLGLLLLSPQTLTFKL